MLRLALATAALVIIAGCSSVPDEVQRTCAAAADPAACQRAAALHQRELDNARLEENSRYGVGY
jgi:hypothetical protein